MGGLDTIAEMYLLMNIYDVHGYSEANNEQLQSILNEALGGQTPIEDLKRQQDVFLERVSRQTFKDPSSYLVKLLREGLGSAGLAREIESHTYQCEDSREETLKSIKFALTPKGIFLAERLGASKDQDAQELVRMYETGKKS